MLTALILGALLLLQATVPAAPAEITLDFIATSQDGQAVTNLAMADINLKVGGKQRPVRSLELVIPAETGRTILLLADEATLYAMEPVAKEAIAKLVASLKPKDNIGYLSARSGRLSPPSTEHELVTRAADAMVTGPGGPRSVFAPRLPSRFSRQRHRTPGVLDKPAHTEHCVRQRESGFRSIPGWHACTRLRRAALTTTAQRVVKQQHDL